VSFWKDLFKRKEIHYFRLKALEKDLLFGHRRIQEVDDDELYRLANGTVESLGVGSAPFGFFPCQQVHSMADHEIEARRTERLRCGKL